MKAVLVLTSVTALALSACSPARQQTQAQPVSNQQQPPLYASINECVEDGNQADVCRQAMTQASSAAPRYNSYASCEQQFGPGNCQTNGGGWVGPALAGFVIGNMLAGNSYNSNGYYRGGRYDYDYDRYRYGGSQYPRGYRTSSRPRTIVNNNTTVVYRDRPAKTAPVRTATYTPAKPSYAAPRSDGFKPKAMFTDSGTRKNYGSSSTSSSYASKPSRTSGFSGGGYSSRSSSSSSSRSSSSRSSSRR